MAVCLSLVAAASAVAQSSVTLAWNPVTNSIAGYRLYRGGASRNYTNNVNAGTATQYTLSNLTAGATYFFAVTAFTSAGAESDYSTEISYTVPGNTNSGTPPVITLISPANGAVYTEPANMNLSANVTPNGHQVTKVQFYNGATLLGESTSTPYSYAWNNVFAGNYSVKARMVYDVGATLDSSAAAVTVASSRPPPTNPAPATLPAPWLAADIGSPGALGTATFTTGAFRVSGAGVIGGTADSFRFVYQTLTGDGEIRAQLNSVQNTGSNGYVGVLMRESLGANSKSVVLGIYPTGAVRAQSRSTTGSSPRESASGTLTTPNAWVRLQRSGDMFTFYSSTDGTNWSRVARQKVTMASSGYFGLAVASGTAGVLNTSTFSNVTAVP